jgi:hypothetical protein
MADLAAPITYSATVGRQSAPHGLCGFTALSVARPGKRYEAIAAALGNWLPHAQRRSQSPIACNMHDSATERGALRLSSVHATVELDRHAFAPDRAVRILEGSA